MVRPTKFILLASIVVPGLQAFSQVTQGQASSNELQLGTGAARQGLVATLPLTLSSTDQVQGLVAAFEWDAAVGVGENLIPGAAIASADTVVKRVESSYMVLGVVVDNDGSEPSFIAPGNGLDLAMIQIRCSTGAPAEVTTPVKFVDSKYATVEGGPLLDNLVTVGGLSISKGEGLKLTNGTLVCRLPDRRVAFKIADGAPDAGSNCGPARVLMDSGLAIEGYELAITHPAADLTLDSIAVGAAATANGADFSKSEVFPNGGALGVVLDLVEPFQNNTIPAGDDLEIAILRYCCKRRPAPPAPAEVFDLKFSDGVLGSPPKDNTAVSGGASLAPELRNGKFTCPPAAVNEDCTNGKDDDGDGLTDCSDPDCAGQPPCVGGIPQMFACGARTIGDSGLPSSASGSVGGDVEVCFFYKSPEDNLPGHQQFDHIQGLSMAVCYPCDLKCREGSFDVSGTIVEAVGADFVSHQCDNDPNDGDGCELIIGILVDSLPPFEGNTLPPTEGFSRIGCIHFTVADDPRLCGKCLPVTFCDGADGRGKVPIKNLISTENESRRPQLMNCEVCIQGSPVFHRGDCNFSSMGSMSVDIADAAATISYLFQKGTWKFTPPCLDACDCNDDGRVDLADATCILQFLFQFGDFPPAPGPGFDMQGRDVPPGPDPTDDKLDCKAGGDC